VREYKSLSTRIICLVFLFGAATHAQEVYVPLNSPVYDYLSRLSIKGVISLHDEVTPYSRMYIASRLRETRERSDLLNSVEKDQLQWYEEEFHFELDPRKNLVPARAYVYGYNDSIFQVKVNPIAGYGVNSTGPAFGEKRWWGGYVYGTYSNSFAAHLDFRDNAESGDNIDSAKAFSPVRGYWINKGSPNGKEIEYSDVKGSIALSWNWGTVSLIKDDIRWGHGTFGQLILSDKPPSYPQLRLTLNPTPWLRFYYMHGWLSSMVYDSAMFYQIALSPDRGPIYRKSYIGKYIAANLLSVNPREWIDLSLGNSVVYTGPSIRPEYLIPFLLYKFQDHNAGRDNDAGNNGQLFVDVSVKYPVKWNSYFTLFVDNLDLTQLLHQQYENAQIGFTLGLKRIDCVVENLDFIAEYTRILPWVYEHYIPTEDFKHLNYPLGDWIGQNADQLRIQLNYVPIYKTTLSAYTELIRKGGLLDVYYYAYELDAGQPFLYGPVRREFDVGIEGTHEVYHDLTVSADVRYSSISDQDSLRTQKFLLGKKVSFGLSVSYGL